ncbi:MAG: ABC transporter substrate-binding protein [Verrucomicrobiaceae bacterium]|nr:ABC transporter substrate-binding protein [Verrucomicrobiaceae bacterium]
MVVQKAQRRVALLILVLGLAALSRWMPDYVPSTPLSVAVSVWPGAETLILARELGEIDDAQVRLVEMSWDSAAMRALGNGAVDAAVLSIDEVTRLRESGQRVKVVLVFDQSQGADSILTNHEGARRVEDLKGLKVGVDVRGSGMVLLASAMNSVGMSPGDVHIVPIAPAEMGVALQSSAVDAVVSAEPWLSALRRDGFNEIDVTARDRQLLIRALVVSSEAARVNANALRSVIAAHFRLLPALKEQRDVPGMEAVLRRERLTREEFKRVLATLIHYDLGTNRRMLASPGGELGTVAALLESLMFKHELLSSSPRPGTWFDASFLPAP